MQKVGKIVSETLFRCTCNDVFRYTDKDFTEQCVRGAIFPSLTCPSCGAIFARGQVRTTHAYHHERFVMEPMEELVRLSEDLGLYQEELDPEFAKVIEENFDDLLA